MKGKWYRSIEIPDDDKPDLDTISLRIARNRLKKDVSKIDINGEAKVYLLAHPSGLGKTTNVAKHVAGYRVLWLCGLHELADATMKDFEKYFKNVKTAHLKSKKYMIEKGELDCECEYEIRQASPGKASGICKAYCHRYRRCEYYPNLANAKESQIVFGMHAHLQFSGFINEYIERSDCIVIDESFSSHYMSKKKFDSIDLWIASDKLSSMAGNKLLEEKIRVNAKELARYFGNIVVRDIKDHVFISESDEFVISDFPIVDEEVKRMYSETYLEDELPFTKDAVSIFDYLSDDTPF